MLAQCDERRVESVGGECVAVEFGTGRHADTQRPCAQTKWRDLAREAIQRVEAGQLTQYCPGVGHIVRENRYAIEALAGRHHTTLADQPN
jgi:hypothetical protein